MPDDLNIKRLSEEIASLTSILKEIRDWLLTRKRPDPEPMQQPAEQNEALQYESRVQNFKCPLCSGPMKARQARTGPNVGVWFAGCAAFPDCKGTRDMSGRNTSRVVPPPAKPKLQPELDDDLDVPF